MIFCIGNIIKHNEDISSLYTRSFFLSNISNGRSILSIVTNSMFLGVATMKLICLNLKRVLLCEEDKAYHTN